MSRAGSLCRDLGTFVKRNKNQLCKYISSNKIIKPPKYFIWPLIACHSPHWNNPLFISCMITEFCVTSSLALDNWGQKYCRTLGYKPNSSMRFSILKFVIIPTIQNYSLPLKLKQRIEQLRMERNSKKINMLVRRIIVSPSRDFWDNVFLVWYLKCHSSRTQTPYSKQENRSNSWVWYKPVWNFKYFWQI